MNTISNFISKNMVNKLIAVNIIVYLLIKVIGLFLFLGASNINVDLYSSYYCAVPASISDLGNHFWTPITYMFLHTDFWHIFGNMLWLFFLGRIFIDFLDGRQLFAVYFLGGLTGALFFVGAYNLFPVFQPVIDNTVALGASAAVSAIVIAICVYKPNYDIYFFALLKVSLKWLAIIYIIFDLLSIPKENPGGHIAHIGGAAFGACFAICLKNGKDITRWFCSMIDAIIGFFSNLFFSDKKPKMKVSYRANMNNNNKKKYSNETYIDTTPLTDEEFNQQKASDQQRMDKILEKISQSGYDYLTQDEKDFLFKMSKNN
ncbi:MAG: rhomboid family intramembrane serine protease [Bacteroidales bacterium]|nr:rhomboid family intramembrane serine protease [Bacteroidales bacterium]